MPDSPPRVGLGEVRVLIDVDIVSRITTISGISGGAALNEVNRGVIILKPKQQFLDWANATDEDGVALTMEEISRDCTAYLTLEIEDDNEYGEFLEGQYRRLFEQELAEWTQDEAQWPLTNDLSNFLEWFDVEFHSIVLDAADGGYWFRSRKANKQRDVRGNWAN